MSFMKTIKGFSSDIAEEAYAQERIQKAREAAAKIVRWPNKILKTPSSKVYFETMSDMVTKQAQELVGAMTALEGVGIAGNQMGYKEAICVCWFNQRTVHDIVVMVNPQIIDKSYTQENLVEGCLSCGSCVGTIRRSSSVTVRYQDLEGDEYIESYDGWNARIVQHEVDHLNGVVILQRMNTVDLFNNRPEMESLQLAAGIVPKRLKRKGLVLRK